MEKAMDWSEREACNVLPVAMFDILNINIHYLGLAVGNYSLDRKSPQKQLRIFTLKSSSDILSFLLCISFHFLPVKIMFQIYISKLFICHCTSHFFQCLCVHWPYINKIQGEDHKISINFKRCFQKILLQSICTQPVYLYLCYLEKVF